MPKSKRYPDTVEAVTFKQGEWRCFIKQVMQRPVWNGPGPAITFGNAVMDGKRKPEPLTA